MNVLITLSALFLSLFMGHALSAQRIGYIEGEKILEQMPEYQKAVEFIESVVRNWENEIEARELELDTLRREFEKERMLLTEEMQQKHLHTIEEKESELRNFQNSRFGYGGMLGIQKNQMLEPIEKKLKEAIRIVSRIKRVDFMFDRSAGLFIPYANQSRDYTDQVIAYLQNNLPEEEEEMEEEESTEEELEEEDDKF